MAKDYTNRKYSIVAYNPLWAQRFNELSNVLGGIYGEYANTIEHVGSTAVPGMAGKPTIDVLIFVQDMKFADFLAEKMKQAGFENLGEYVKQGTRLFVHEVDGTRICNVHVFQKDDPKGEEMLKIRDYFLSHSGKVQEYSELKLRLFAKYPNDYATYRKYKDEWMQELADSVL